MYFSTFHSKKDQIERILLPALVAVVGIALIMVYRGGSAVSDPASLLLGINNGVPLSFIPNVGQSDGSALYILQQSGMGTAFNETGLTFSWAETEEGATHVVNLQYIGASATAVQSDNLLPGVVNYLQGNNQANWHTNVPTYGKVSYKNLYPGIDLVYSGSGQELLATFQLESGADLDKIVWQFTGATAAVDAETGALLLSTDGRQSPIQLAAPQAWQTVAGESAPLAVNYAIGSDRLVGLSATEETSADPTFVALSMTLPGGWGEEVSGDIAVDDSGDVYVLGSTASTNFPTVNPIQSYAGIWDIFVSKFSADGSALLYSTYIGGSETEFDNAMAIDGSGVVYLTAHTLSTDFPMVNPLQTSGDAVIVILSADGSSLLYSTYFGGSLADSILNIYPRDGDLFLTGRTYSDDFPTVNPIQSSLNGSTDAFITRLTPSTNTIVYSSFLGGSSDDSGGGLAIDSNGNIILAGVTHSNDFPTVNPIQANYMGNMDLFLTALAADGGSYLYSTYLGGSYSETGAIIALDSADNVHLVGGSDSNDFPLVDPFPVPNPTGSDAVIATVSSDGSALLFSGLLGASGLDRGIDIAVDNNGNTYVIVNTSSPDFPLQNPIQSERHGSLEIAVAKLDTNNDLVFSSYLGGEQGDGGGGIAVDGAQNIYLTGDTLSPDFPVVNAFQPYYAGGAGDVIVAKINGTDYSLDYSTYLGGGPYTAPTDVSMTDFNGRSSLSNALLYLAAALLLILLVGSALIRRQRRPH